MNEYTKIVRSSVGRVVGSQGPVSGAKIRVLVRDEEMVFQTESKNDGSYELGLEPGRYLVTIDTPRLSRFLYVLDLRKGDSKDRFEAYLGAGGCNDVRIVEDEQGSQKPDACAAEKVSLNLVLRRPTEISGVVKDESGAPFVNSEVRLATRSAIELQPSLLMVKTDSNGNFHFDESEPGSYRLLASPHRGFAQPEKLDCYEQAECKLDIVLKANSSDLPYAACPIK